VGLAYCAATGDADVKRADALLEHNTEDFNRLWLEQKRLGWVGDMMYGRPSERRRSVAA
jgi:hypothetical protein